MRVVKLHVAASPSPASRGKAGMGDSVLRLNPLKCEVVWPPPRSSPIYGGGRCCNMRVLKLHVATSPYSNTAASPSPALRGKAGMEDSVLRLKCVRRLKRVRRQKSLAFQHLDICATSAILHIFTLFGNVFGADLFVGLISPAGADKVHHIRDLLIIHTPAKCRHGDG